MPSRHAWRLRSRRLQDFNRSCVWGFAKTSSPSLLHMHAFVCVFVTLCLYICLCVYMFCPMTCYCQAIDPNMFTCLRFFADILTVLVLYIMCIHAYICAKSWSFLSLRVWIDVLGCMRYLWQWHEFFAGRHFRCCLCAGKLILFREPCCLCKYVYACEMCVMWFDMLCRTVVSIPAHKQKKLFDYVNEAERTLHDLENMSPVSILSFRIFSLLGTYT